MPAFRVGKPRCRLVLTANQTLAAGDNLIVWDAATFDDVGGWDGNDSYQFDRDGLFAVAATAKYQNVSPSAVGTLRLLLNGSTYTEVSSANVSTLKMLEFADLLEVAEGDVLHLEANNNPSTSSLLIAAATRLVIVRVGPKAWV